MGPDIICALNNWPQLYSESVADVGDVAEEIGKTQGGYYQVSRNVAKIGSKWIAVPWCIVGPRIAYRRSWFEEVGYNKFPETWEEYRAAGKKLKAKGHPLGQTLDARRHPDAQGDPKGPRRLRDRPGPCQEGAVGRRPQSL